MWCKSLCWRLPHARVKLEQRDASGRIPEEPLLPARTLQRDFPEITAKEIFWPFPEPKPRPQRLLITQDRAPEACFSRPVIYLFGCLFIYLFLLKLQPEWNLIEKPQDRETFMTCENSLSPEQIVIGSGLEGTASFARLFCFHLSSVDRLFFVCLFV